MLDIKDFDLKQLRTQATSQPTCELPKKVFVPFCRVKPGQEIFKNKEYEWGELPEELYAKFSHKVWRSDVKVISYDLDDYDVLIGMDVISLTDFLITNKDNTVFSFRYPSEGGELGWIRGLVQGTK